MRTLLLLMIRGYRFFLSPWVGQHCRFYPSCSCYAQTAIQRFGAWRGLGLALRRLGRCHPWHAGGVDPVPEHLTESGQAECASARCTHHG